jgi:hypothetical protein
MSKKNLFYPGFNDENLDRDKEMNDDLAGERDIEGLAYNEEDDSSEIDVPTQDEFYDHPNPYKTSVKNGGDFNSDYDEANKEALDQYQENVDEEPYDEYGMRIDNGSIVALDPIDESLAETPEDQREDLDEEGYPLNDGDTPLT